MLTCGSLREYTSDVVPRPWRERLTHPTAVSLTDCLCATQDLAQTGYATPSAQPGLPSQARGTLTLVIYTACVHGPSVGRNPVSSDWENPHALRDTNRWDEEKSACLPLPMPRLDDDRSGSAIQRHTLIGFGALADRPCWMAYCRSVLASPMCSFFLIRARYPSTVLTLICSSSAVWLGPYPQPSSWKTSPSRLLSLDRAAFGCAPPGCRQSARDWECLVISRGRIFGFQPFAPFA